MSTPDYIYPIIVPSDSNVEDAFSSINTPDYTPASPDYSPASSGNTSSDPSEDLSKDLLASLAISSFLDDPYMKVMQAYDATSNKSPIPLPQALIAPPTILPLSLVLPPTPPRDIEPPVGSPISLSPSSSVGSSSPVRSTTPPPDYPFDESIFAELDNSLWIIPRPLGGEPVPEESNESDTCLSVHL
ncbi:hypothetical protein Tco_1039371 [Tanacetum coccineum]